MRNFFKKVVDHFIPSPRNVYRPHMLRRAWLIFFLAVILTAEGVFVFDLMSRQAAFNFLAAVLPGEVIALTNDERAAYQVSTLTDNALLDAAAQAKAEDMAAQGYFAHIGPDGKEPWAWMSEAGYTYRSAGENLAVRFADSRDVVNAWMASPTHRANIIKPVYTEIGVGVAQGMFQGEPATFVVQYFGTPADVAVAAPISPQPISVAQESLPGASSAQVQGAETEAATSAAPAAADVRPAAPEAPSQTVALPQSDSPWSSFARELVRGGVYPGGAVVWVLGGVAALLLLGLALAFFIHIQVQATDMLVGGAVIAAVAISLVALNVKTPFVSRDTSQAAAVFGALPTTGGFIDSTAAAITP